MKVFTLGYEKRNIEEFIAVLKEANVQVLVDVRETPWSYKKDFCKTRLKEALVKKGIEYVHVKGLGNPKQLRKSNTDRGTILNKYRKYLDETESGVLELMGIIDHAKKKKSNLCLTCYEREHLECHRSVIIDHIKSIISVTVTHL